MAHKKKEYADSDNSRQAYRWRKKNNRMTKADHEREEKRDSVEKGSAIRAMIQSGEVKTKIKGSKFVYRMKK